MVKSVLQDLADELRKLMVEEAEVEAEAAAFDTIVSELDVAMHMNRQELTRTAAALLCLREQINSTKTRMAEILDAG